MARTSSSSAWTSMLLNLAVATRSVAVGRDHLLAEAFDLVDPLCTRLRVAGVQDRPRDAEALHRPELVEQRRTAAFERREADVDRLRTARSLRVFAQDLQPFRQIIEACERRSADRRHRRTAGIGKRHPSLRALGDPSER